jgi:hypothetical protein
MLSKPGFIKALKRYYFGQVNVTPELHRYNITFCKHTMIANKLLAHRSWQKVWRQKGACRRLLRGKFTEFCPIHVRWF